MAFSRLRSDFHFDSDYTDGQVPLTEVHDLQDYEARRYAIALAAGAGAFEAYKPFSKIIFMTL